MTSAKTRIPRRPKTGPAAPREWSAEEKSQIAEKAFQNFLARGSEQGSELEDWLRAEAEFAAALAASKPRRAVKPKG